MARICHMIAGLLLTGVLALAPNREARAADVTVFAAASLKNALEEIRADFEATTGQTVALSFAGSSLLARQITLGAPADIYLPASADWMDYLQTEGHLVAGSRRDLLGNRLVLIAPRSSAQPIFGFDDPALLAQLGQGRLAMALVTAVPAGIYGKSALQNLGIWQDLAPKIAQTDNVRAALALVAAEEAPLGIVYASDAQAEPRVVVLAEFPQSTHAPIRYPLALIPPAKTPAILAFYTYLQQPVAQEVFRAAGFDVLAE
ncbi:molybdate ABC transporter substrate-binding protein [Pseudophaeobacter sp.]|uniref:molybdate ABC transporter substrate-binding protein n=1 Tax=Pseudophaeobacter sp. TaxID=1971739 RepID=UPI00329A2B02